ncbi:hypothetical protein D9M70_538030 [compost metagenome]
MTEDVARLVGNQRGGVEDMALGGVFFLDQLQLVLAVFAEQVLEQLIQARAVFHCALGRAAFIKHRHCRAIRLGFLDGVLVDKGTENLVGALLVAHDDRRAGKADAHAVG